MQAVVSDDCGYKSGSVRYDRSEPLTCNVVPEFLE